MRYTQLKTATASKEYEVKAYDLEPSVPLMDVGSPQSGAQGGTGLYLNTTPVTNAIRYRFTLDFQKMDGAYGIGGNKNDDGSSAGFGGALDSIVVDASNADIEAGKVRADIEEKVKALVDQTDGGQAYYNFKASVRDVYKRQLTRFPSE